MPNHLTKIVSVSYPLLMVTLGHLQVAPEAKIALTAILCCGLLYLSGALKSLSGWAMLAGLGVAFWLLPLDNAIRVYPMIISLFFTTLFASHVFSGKNLLFSLTPAKIQSRISEKEKSALKSAQWIWIVGLVLNTVALAITTVAFSERIWLLVSQCYSYAWLLCLFLLTFAYVPIKAFGFREASKRAGQVCRQGFGLAMFGFACILYIPLLPAVWLACLGNKERFCWFNQKVNFYCFKSVVFMCEKLSVIKVHFNGLVPSKLSNLVLCNHISMFDIITILAKIPHCHTFVHAKFLTNPILKPIILSAGYIAVDPTNVDSRIGAYLHARRLLEEGKRIVIFPESTRSLDGKIGKFFDGSFRLGADLNCAITPIFLSCDYPLFTKEKVFHFYNEVPQYSLNILQSLTPNEHLPRKSRIRDLHHRTEKAFLSFQSEQKALAGGEGVSVKS